MEGGAAEGGSSSGGAPEGGMGGTPSTGGMGGEGGETSNGGGGAEPVGGGGEGGSEAWPECDTQPNGSPTQTLEQIWQEDPAAPEEAWVPGVYVTAVSGGGCVATQACQIFVQQEETYATLVEATHQSLRIGIAPAAAEHFVGIEVGDQIDLYAHAVRDTQGGKNELIFLVTANLPGCAEVIGSGDPQPVLATLDELTVAAYEEEIGPVLIEVAQLSGNPDLPTENFALWETGQPIDGDITTVTSLSPFFLNGSEFTGLTEGVNTAFLRVVGVFGQFAPPADPLIKYEVIYVREDAEYPLAQ